MYAAGSARVALVSLTLIALELVWTRIFSAEFFYTYAFLALSVAVMALGLGALALRLFPALQRSWVLGLSMSLCALAALAGPLLVFRLGLDFSVLFVSWNMVARLVAMLLLLGAPFFCGGIALATIFRRHCDGLPRLYMADLIGAGVGVVVAIVLMNRVGTPVAAFWIVLPVLVAALGTSRGWLRLVPVAGVAAVVLLSGRAPALLDANSPERAPVIYKHWDAMAKVKAYDYGGEARGINIDNVANTPVLRYESYLAERADSGGVHWDIDAGYLVRQFDECTFLSLGCGGGFDVLQAMDKGATRIHAVDVNPHIVRMLHDGDPDGYIVHDSSTVDSTGQVVTMAAFSGHIFRDPRVVHVAEDARRYVRRHPDTFDVIFSLSSNTWAALASGSFALAENYLFTTEAFVDYWNALTANGFLSMEHQVYMPRLVSEVIDALERVGVKNPRDHFAVYDFPTLRRNVLLLSKRPLTDEIRYNAYGPLSPDVFATRHLLYPPADSARGNLIDRIVTNGWRAERDSADVNISPCTDDRPFIAQMGLWRNLHRDALEKVSRYAELRGFPLSGIIIGVILAVIIVLLIPLNLLPYAFRGEKLAPAPWLYFFLIGVAFMSVEIVLIQRYTLFIGASVYSIATVLLSLLVSSGIGSRFATRVPDQVAFAAIALWLVLEVLVLRGVTARLPGLGLAARLALTAAFVSPVGFFMGMPFPKGGLRVGPLVDWGFAVNGAGSILGATAVVVVSFRLGFNTALLLAALVYALAYALLGSFPAIRRETSGSHSP